MYIFSPVAFPPITKVMHHLKDTYLFEVNVNKEHICLNYIKVLNTYIDQSLGNVCICSILSGLINSRYDFD